MTKLIILIKHLILCALRPIERSGIVLSMPRKNVPQHIRALIQKHRKNSFCPWIHFAHAWRALEHVNQRNIPGDVVLCGVATGGLAAFMATFLNGRTLWLYDTFDGGSLPGPKDGAFEREHGEHIKSVMATSLTAVRDYIGPNPGITWVVGDVMKTLPDKAPSDGISLLYLDTDYYESTLHELKHLYPRVCCGGIVIQDDMGLCQGAAKAVAEYFGEHPPFIVPMDEAGCILVKP